jgi:hypothetical protein
MRAALISPASLLQRVQPYSDYHLILTHLVIYNRAYCDFYATRSKAGDYIILDNSAAEKNARSLPLKNIVLAAVLVKPRVVVLPDYLFDARRTLDELANALRSPQLRFMRRVLPETKLCGVIQGVDVHDWFDCFEILNDERSGVDILGVPMLTTQLFGSRVSALEHIARKVQKPVHLFGFWHGVPMSEVSREKQFPFVVGIDTSKPVKLAVQGKPLSDWLLLERDRAFIDRSNHTVDADLLRNNCIGFVEACR